MIFGPRIGMGQNPLRALAIAGVDDRITLGGSMDLFNESSAPFTRRTLCWAFDIVGMSALCTDQHLTLVTPDIVLGVTHAFPANGSTCTFVSEDGNNTSESATISGSVNLGPGQSGDGGDITVGRLSAPIPSGVRPARLAVGTLTNFLPPAFYTFSWGVPLMESTGTRKATVTNWNWVYPPPYGEFSENMLAMAVPITAPRSDYYVAKGSDSGCGCGIIVNDEFISLMALSYALGGGTGWANFKYLEAITAAIATLGSATSLSLFDPATL